MLGTAAVAALAVAGGTAMAIGGDDDEKPITGDALRQASAAALAHTGEGTVTETEVGDEESLYEVEVTLEDGTQVDVQLDAVVRRPTTDVVSLAVPLIALDRRAVVQASRLMLAPLIEHRPLRAPRRIENEESARGVEQGAQRVEQGVLLGLREMAEQEADEFQNS